VWKEQFAGMNTTSWPDASASLSMTA